MGMKRKLRPIFLLAVLGAIGGGLWMWRSHQTTDPTSQLVLYGNVDIRQVELAINASERIAALLVEEGDRVATGQLLARLETERFELAVARDEAQMENQKQVVARLEAGTRPEEIRKARADVAAAMAALDEADRTFKRVSVLVPQQGRFDSETGRFPGGPRFGPGPLECRQSHPRLGRCRASRGRHCGGKSDFKAL